MTLQLFITCCIHSQQQTNKFQTNCKQILTNKQPNKQTNRAAAVASGVVEHLASVVVFAHSTTRSEMRAALEEHLLQGTRELSETERAALAAAAADVSAAAGDDGYSNNITNAPLDASFSDNSFDISRAEGGGRTSDECDSTSGRSPHHVRSSQLSNSAHAIEPQTTNTAKSVHSQPPPRLLSSGDPQNDGRAPTDGGRSHDPGQCPRCGFDLSGIH
jgi:hypothetical protein